VAKHWIELGGQEYCCGAWFADFEGVIKRELSDEHGNPCGYELLDGDYPKDWGVVKG